MEGERTNTSILSSLELKFINFMLPRFPKWVTPDILTGLGFLSSIFIFLGYLFARFNKAGLFLVSFFIITHWFADSHDGGLAKFRKKSRPRYGYYLDHILDFVTVFMIFLGFLVYGLNSIAVVLLFGAYSLLFFHSVLCYETTKKLQLSFGKISPTEARLFIIILNVLLFFNLKFYVEVIFYFTSVLIFIYSVYEIIKTSIKLDKKDREKYWK